MKAYQSILIHPTIKGGRCSGTLHLDGDKAIFSSDEITHEFHLAHVSISAGGAGNGFVFLNDKRNNEITAYTSDKSILKDESLTSSLHLKDEISKSKKTLTQPLVITVSVIGVIILLIASIYFSKDFMVEKLANQVPLEWEQNAGDKLFNALSLQYHFIKNDSLKKEFLKVGEPLFKQIETKGFKIDLYFVREPTINAFALPGGKVIVQTGLIDNAKSWEEVMGVLGHELAHVTRRHHIRGVINNIGLFALLSALIGDVSALAGTFANIGGELASLSNSRSFENEADETGWNYLVDAKINPQGLISFFETLKKEHETKLDSTLTNKVDLSFLSTHPNTQDRIDHLKEKEKKLHQSFKPLPNTFDTFKTALLKLK